jgi:aspartyl-tRNA(Asn)/glutamyl-tRNA(Gln) amidotransferase subunit C
MPIDQKTAKTIAELARLDLTFGRNEAEAPELLEKLTEEFSKIVGYMDILGEVDTTGVEPLYSPMLEPESPREDLPLSEELRKSKAEAILERTALASGRFFSVPRVV